MSDLTFLKNAIQQQQSNKGNMINQSSQIKVPDSTSLTLQELTRMAQAHKEAQARSNPNWFNKSSKRTIPGHLIKRSSVKLHQNQSEEDDMDTYNSNSSSQTSKKILSSFKKLSSSDETNLYPRGFIKNSLDSELPPKRSIYDLNYDNDDRGSSSDYSMKNTNESIVKDPMNFKNAFNSNIRMGLTTNSSIASSKLGSDLNLKSENSNYGTLFGKEEPVSIPSTKSQFSTPSHHSTEQRQTQQQQSLESAVIVFGYDDNSFAEVLQHFSKFGTVLEDFNIHNNLDTPSSPGPLFSPRKKTYPIFIGKSWVKLTYDNPASAIRACRDNENLNIAGQSINIIPYSREVLEKFLNNKINDQDDIGDSLNNLNFAQLNNVPEKFETLLRDTSIMDSSMRKNEVPNSSSIKIKNGENLFINTPKKKANDNDANKHPNFLKKASDLLFGFDNV